MRVVLVDDHIHIHKIVETLLESTPDIRLVGQAANGQEALELCKQVQPDVVLMDVVMPVMDGIEATRLLREQYPGVKVLAISSFQDQESIIAMLKQGALGYIIKTTLAQDLVETIRTVGQGKMVFSPEVVDQLVSPQSKCNNKKNFQLTEREMEVLFLMAEGLNMPKIAARLIISHSTVKFHVENICHKLGVNTRSEALIVAAKNNLV